MDNRRHHRADLRLLDLHRARLAVGLRLTRLSTELTIEMHTTRPVLLAAQTIKRVG
jgi:hypothetical protein